MDNIANLVKLQEYYTEKEVIGKVLKNKSELIQLKKLKNNYDAELKKYHDLKVDIDKFEEEYSKLAKNIENKNNDKKVLEQSLYSNSTGSNIKLINGTQSKINIVEEELSKLEYDKKNILNKQEKLIYSKQDMEQKLETLKNDFYKLKNNIINKIQKAKLEQKNIEKVIIEARKIVPDKILNIFDDIMSRKTPVIVPIIDKTVCDGCKMSLPVLMVKEIKECKEDKLFYCENCGRIIYIKK